MALAAPAGLLDASVAMYFCKIRYFCLESWSVTPPGYLFVLFFLKDRCRQKWPFYKLQVYNYPAIIRPFGTSPGELEMFGTFSTETIIAQ